MRLPRVNSSTLPKWCLGAEFLVLFGVVPTLYWQDVIPVPLIPGIILFAAICVVLLLLDPSFDRRLFWNSGGWATFRRHARGVLLRFVVLGGLLTLAVALWEPQRLLSFPRRNPGLYAAVMVLYPIFSVYGQELIYRVFLFHRYRMLFTSGWARIAASAIAFGYVHILFDGNPWISVALTTVGGVVFAWTYEKTRSVPAVWLEHALYGNLVWTIGLGEFFYAGRRV